MTLLPMNHPLGGGGLFGSPQFGKKRFPDFQQMPSPQMPQQQEQKPWYDTTSGKLAMAGQILMSKGRENPMLGVMQYKQQMADQERMAAQQREQGLQDWRRQYDYQVANPKPTTQNPYRWRANNGDLMELDPATGKARTAFQDPTPKTEWIQVKDPVSGAVSIIPKPMGGGAMPSFSQEDWDNAASAGDMGGAGGNVSSTFLNGF